MPRYFIENNAVAKYLTDEERKARGFMNGDCVDACMIGWKDLTSKFGDNFDMVYIMIDRRTASITRLMNEEQQKEFMNAGRYQGHFVLYNRKTKMYIDKSNGQQIISGEKEFLSNFNDSINKYVRVYHFGVEFISHLVFNNKKVGKFMCDMLRYYQDRLPTHKEEVRWRKDGMRVIKSI